MSADRVECPVCLGAGFEVELILATEDAVGAVLGPCVLCGALGWLTPDELEVAEAIVALAHTHDLLATGGGL